MRDDDSDDDSDDEFDDDSYEGGKILQSGIDPRASRAEYALPLGQPALQDGPIEFEIPEVSEPRTGPSLSRRRVLAIGAGVGFAGATGLQCVFKLMSPDTSPEPVRAPEPVSEAMRSETESMISLARRFARGRFDRLVESHATYIWLVDQYGRDDVELIDGLVRLARYALIERGDQAVGIARHLVRAYEFEVPPRPLREAISGLKNLLRDRGRRRR